MKKTNDKKDNICIPYRIIRRIALLYVTLPLVLFFIGFLRWYFAILACCTLVVCFLLSEEKSFSQIKLLFKENKGGEKTSYKFHSQEESIPLSRWMVIAIFIISFIYSFFCGIGRFWAQSKDYPWRNAIFRDLIYRDWPVKYDKYGGALVYYIGQWLSPALFGKIAYLLGAGEKISFLIGNIALILYVTVGLSILFLLLFSYFKPKGTKAMLLVILGFIFFSGMDIVASIEPLGANNYHLEWWAHDYQYSSFTTCMCWVFNQAIIPWICMALFIKEKSVKNYVLIGMSCLFSGPLPFVGFFVYCITNGFAGFIKAIKTNTIVFFMKDVFSISNILATVGLFPFIGAYYLSNAIIANSGNLGLSNAVTDVESRVSLATTVATEVSTNPVLEAVGTYIEFILLEFGIFALIVLWRNYKNYLYYVTIVQLLVYPFIKLGYSSDFTMRASIPAIFMMYIFCYEFVLNSEENFPKKEEKGMLMDGNSKNKGWNIQILKRYAYVILVCCLILGVATPAVEFIRGFRQVAMRGIDDPVTDFLYTLGGDGPYNHNTYYPEPNFVALDLDNQLFFKYFAK